LLIGDATKARTKLGWKPEYDLDALINEMIWSDIEMMKKEEVLKKAGYEIKNYFE
jgi:GDPmannose 4,6-dehydratase